MNELALGSDATAGGGDKAASAAALVTSSGALLACSACCVLPLALPAVALAVGATTLAWMEAAHGWLTLVALLMLVTAWGLVWRQTTRTGRGTAKATVYILTSATVLTGIALAWSWIEPSLMALFKA